MFDNKKNVLVAVLIVGVVAMTVAFAALSTNLRISGTASVPNTNWNIHFANWALDTASTVTVGSNTQQNTAVYPSVNDLQMSLAPNVTLVEGLNITLYQPNDYAKYTFDIVNDGTIDGSLDNFTHTMTCESGKNCDFLEYTVECKDSQLNTVTTGYVLPHGQSVSCYLQLKFKDVDNTAMNNNTANNMQASVVNGVYTQEATSATLAASWQWVQKKEQQANSGSGSGNNEPVTPSNPYETTFDGNYTAYKYTDADLLDPIYNYDFSDSTEGYGDNECPDGYRYYSGNNEYDAGCYYATETGWSRSLNSESATYLRTTGSLPEVCGEFGSGQAGTVCLTSSYYNSSYSSINNYYADFEDVNEDTYDITTAAGLSATGLKGYSLAKATEMLNKGASSCTVNYGETVYCNMTSDGYCGIDRNGNVDCNGGNGDSSNVFIGWDGYAN